MSAFLRKYRGLLIVLLLAVIAVSVYVYLQRGKTSTVSQYQTAKIERGNLVATIGATGTVRAKQSSVLVWETAGTVDTVNVKVGDNVPADFVMAYLKKTSLSQNIILAETDLANAKTSLDNLLNSSTALAQAQQNLANAKQAVEDAQKNVTKLDYKRASDDLIKKTKDEIALAKQQVSRAESAYNLLKSRPNGDSLKAQFELNLINARTNRDAKIATLNWYLGVPSELDAAKYRAALAVAQSQETDAQREFDRLSAGNVAEIAAAQARIDAAQATLNLARIIAPFPGIVTEANVIPGDQVNAGKTAFRIDNMSSLYVDVDVSEVDINSVTVGQPVTLSFDAILEKDTPYNGVIVNVAQAGTAVQGVVSFKVTVELTDADQLVKPGMTAAVNIVVKEIKDEVLVPNRAVRLSDGVRVVYLLVDGQAVKTEIRLGSSSDSMSVIAGGNVKEGDVIILNPPTDFAPGGGPGGGGFGG
ncbi:MAG: efflux RND transporter periplasmic adaptor subunit [Chloroflexota bacterium]